jgi:hemerythrin superfamily protein
MNIYSALKKDHQKIETLLNRLVDSSEQGTDEWKGLVKEIRDELIPHSRAEEALFYNPIRETEHGSGLIAHSYTEHAVAETELRTLQAMEAINANWTALAKKLRHDLLHHVEEEEGKVFGAAKLVFSDEEAEQIGESFEQLKPMVKEQSFAETSMDLVKNLLPKRFRKNSDVKKAA